jgi:hypothetical protein
LELAGSTKRPGAAANVYQEGETMSADQSTLAKVKKLLALATANDNPNESSAALAKAQELMRQHGLTMTDATAPVFTTDDVGTKMSISKPKSWELGLMATVARAFGCKIIWQPGYGRVTARYQFLGEASRVQLATYTAVVLQRRLYSARAKFLASLPSLMRKEAKSREVDGYCTGWVAAVARPVRAFALPPAEAAALEAEEKRRTTDPDGKARQAKASDKNGSAYGQLAGLRDGAKESLQRPMSDESSPVKKLASA